jgi:hypothetical protein
MHDPYDYLTDVLTRPPTQRASEIHQLLPNMEATCFVAQGMMAGRIQMMVRMHFFSGLRRSPDNSEHCASVPILL